MYASLCGFPLTRIGCRLEIVGAFEGDQLASQTCPENSTLELSSFSWRNLNNLKLKNPKFNISNPKT